VIYLVRHGLDDETFIGGWSNVDLIKKGIKQSHKLGKFINENFNIDKIYTSDVTRALSTSNIINEYIDVEVIEEPRFRELNKGLLNGMDVGESYIKYPEYKDLKDIHIEYPEGESYIGFYERIKKELDYILSLDNCIIVTHRGVINVLYFILNNMEPNLDKKQFGVKHATIHELDPDKKTIRRLEGE